MDFKIASQRSPTLVGEQGMIWKFISKTIFLLYCIIPAPPSFDKTLFLEYTYKVNKKRVNASAYIRFLYLMLISKQKQTYDRNRHTR